MLSRLAIVLFLGIQATNAQQQQQQGIYQVPPDGCIDPQGLADCNTRATNHIPECVANLCNADKIPCFGQPGCQQQAICLNSCECTGYQSSLVCAMTSCWNKAASCEYQALAISALRQCPDLMAPPYFPPQDSDAGQCSCQLGTLDLLVEQTLPEGLTSCQASLQQGDNLDASTQCGCCGSAWELSAAIAACPNNNPGNLPFIGQNMVQAASTLDSSSCSSVFAAGIVCSASSIGFSLGSYSFYSTSFPSPVSATLSNSPGELSTPISASFDWHPYGETNTVMFPIVAVTTSGQAVQSTGSGGSGGSSPQQAGTSPGITGTMGTAAGSSSPPASTSRGSWSRAPDFEILVALLAGTFTISMLLA